ncbi:flavodoxin family protein [Thermodesulfobacteriota bacterium]
MEPVPIKITGISGTMIKGGNCDKVMVEALKTAESFDHVETEFITLADKEIMACKHCQWCIENRKPCKYNDDATWILDKMVESDGLIWGSPVWSHTIAPWMMNLCSRSRFMAFMTGELRDKVLGTYVISWFGVGEEMALMTLEALGHNVLMLPVYRGWARVSKIAFGERPDYMENGALDDTSGMVRIRTMAKRVVEISRKMKFAEQHGIGLPENETRSITCGRYPLWHKKQTGETGG